MTRLLILLASSALFPLAVSAQTIEAPSTDSAVDQAEASGGASDEIVVTGSRRREDDVLGDVSVLGGESLVQELRPTLGATLSSQPGVTTSGSGPNVARPVLRGLSGDRIRILTDGIGSLDVSASSSDHAVAINPLTAQSIEVIHGPAALIFGSSAIGGVVNVIDNRIPRKVPDAPLHAQGIAGYGTAANERLASGEIDVPVARNIVAHGDVSWTKNDDLHIGGHVIAKPLRRIAEASPDADIRALADLEGKLPNSDGRTFEAAGALAYVDGGLNIGGSVTRRTAFYGVPVRYSLDPAVEAEETHIDVHQTRYDARAEIPLEGFLKQVRLRGGYSDYTHAEVVGDGEIGSRVFSKGGEARLDLDQRDGSSGWGGASGAQYLDIKQRIEGDEQFMPPVHQKTLGLFTVQHIENGALRLEAGARFEHNAFDAAASDIVGNPDLERDFSTLSLSAGARYALSPEWGLSLSLARSQRAPSAEELFANGPHAGNASFQVGDPDLDDEKSIGFEASVRHSSDALNVSATLYGSRYSNFLYEAPTGEIRDDLPVYEARQGQATYTGFEAEAQVPLGTLGGIKWDAEAVADATRAKIKGFGPAPLIPPLRVQGALTGEAGRLGGRLEVEHSWTQNRTAPLETSTPGFTLVNASFDWKPLEDRPDLTLSFAANNIFDVEARHSTSLLKDYAPIAGRDFRVTASLDF